MLHLIGDINDYLFRDDCFVIVPMSMSVDSYDYSYMNTGIGEIISSKRPYIRKWYGGVLKRHMIEFCDSDVIGYEVNKDLNLIMLPVKRRYNEKADLKLVEFSFNVLKLWKLNQKQKDMKICFQYFLQDFNYGNVGKPITEGIIHKLLDIIFHKDDDVIFLNRTPYNRSNGEKAQIPLSPFENPF